MTRKARRRPASEARWSARVTRGSNALDLDAGVFTWDDPRRIAASLKRSAERSRRRKASAFRSAMSMLVFFRNRAGRGLSPERRRVLLAAQRELRRQFGRAPARPASRPSHRRR
ncbi:MAG TPA: DUF3175 domain-containing protein [Planctomycetota bacterium]|nr:DUF3175 domain-containing protein [Planctomycetota bacterium]